MSREKKQFMLLCLIHTAILFLPLMSSAVFAQTQYTVKSGDTIYSIARQYNLSSQDVLQANNINDPTEIGVGTSVLIPHAGETTAVSVSISASVDTYAVQKGDTYFSIAKRHNLSVTELLQLNSRTTDQVLRISEVIRLSVSAPAAPASSRIVAQGGAARTAAFVATPVAARVATTDGSSVWPHGGVRKSIDGKFPAVVISASEGDVVRAVTGGRVVHIDSSGAFGRVVFVQAASGHIYIYGGNEKTLVGVGDRITIGTLVGRVGGNRIGNDGSQIYFSVWHNNVFIDPHLAPRG